MLTLHNEHSSLRKNIVIHLLLTKLKNFYLSNSCQTVVNGLMSWDLIGRFSRLNSWCSRNQSRTTSEFKINLFWGPRQNSKATGSSPKRAHDAGTSASSSGWMNSSSVAFSSTSRMAPAPDSENQAQTRIRATHKFTLAPSPVETKPAWWMLNFQKSVTTRWLKQSNLYAYLNKTASVKIVLLDGMAKYFSANSNRFFLSQLFTKTRCFHEAMAKGVEKNSNRI